MASSNPELQITIPVGVQAGQQQLRVQTPDGRSFDATVPAGLRPGTTLCVQVPQSAAGPVAARLASVASARGPLSTTKSSYDRGYHRWARRAAGTSRAYAASVGVSVLMYNFVMVPTVSYFKHELGLD